MTTTAKMTIKQQLYNSLQELEMTSDYFINGNQSKHNLTKYLNAQKTAIHLLEIHKSNLPNTNSES